MAARVGDILKFKTVFAGVAHSASASGLKAGRANKAIASQHSRVM